MRLAALRSDEQGVSAIEFALILPFMLMFAMGTMEYVNYIHAHSQVSHAALTIADTASRTFATSAVNNPPMRERDITDAIVGGRLDASNLDLKRFGRISLSSLELNKDNKQIIQWQRCFGDYRGSMPFYGSQGAVLSGGMGPAGNTITATANNAVMFAQVTYRYQPLFYAPWLSDAARTITYTAAYQVRDDRELGKAPANPAPAVPVLSCT